MAAEEEEEEKIRSRVRDCANHQVIFRSLAKREGTFFERWQRDFRQSRHPLSRALHRMVKLEELEKCSGAADYLYSRSIFALIDAAKATSDAKTIQSPHNPIVRLEDVTVALLMRVHQAELKRIF